MIYRASHTLLWNHHLYLQRVRVFLVRRPLEECKTSQKWGLSETPFYFRCFCLFLPVRSIACVIYEWLCPQINWCVHCHLSSWANIYLLANIPEVHQVCIQEVCSEWLTLWRVHLNLLFDASHPVCIGVFSPGGSTDSWCYIWAVSGSFDRENGNQASPHINVWQILE